MDRRIAAIVGLLYDIGRLAQLAQPSAQDTDSATLSEAFICQYVPASLLSSDSQDALRATVRLADQLAAGGESGQSQPRALLSVFCQIGEDPARRPKKAYLSLRPLALDKETLFPATGIQETTAAYARLWQELQDEAGKLRGETDAETYIESLYHLLHRITWCVPSGAEGYRFSIMAA